MNSFQRKIIIPLVAIRISKDVNIRKDLIKGNINSLKAKKTEEPTLNKELKGAEKGITKCLVLVINSYKNYIAWLENLITTSGHPET